MAIRNLRLEGDPILRKTSREVKEITPKVRELIDDMLETMYEKDGVGLAAPQVGILKRIVVIDVGDGPLVMINPEIVREEGSQTGDEGCLSVPGKAGQRFSLTRKEARDIVTQCQSCCEFLPVPHVGKGTILICFHRRSSFR